MRILAIVAAVSALAGCAATEFSVPVSGQLADGRPLAGSATARIDGNGTFEVTMPDGNRCAGTYDSMSMADTFTVPVVCDDGRAGDALIDRAPGGLSGTAVVTLADGTTGRLVFGSLTYEEAFAGAAE